MKYDVRKEGFDSLSSYWGKPELDYPSVFVTPAFLKSWWRSFHEEDTEPLIIAIHRDEKPLGIAPLKVKKGVASFIGNRDVCDYLDFITAPGREEEFLAALLNYLMSSGVRELDLSPVRSDSLVMTRLTGMAEKQGYNVTVAQEDVSLEVALPGSWDKYLQMLDGKQRHELRRKLRRLDAAGSINYRVISDAVSIMSLFDTFLELFGRSRDEKASFMTDRMAGFFRTLAKSLSEVGLMRFGVLELAGEVIAMVMCFDYRDVIYLYNSAYEPEKGALSPGIASKACYIRDSIEKGKKIFNFLKGSETYKYQMGGREIPIYRCRIIK